ncbi:hypothetical protein ULMS_24770 [Patiriisocius marinistellae]|uniref:Uncharacterized protein n=1 Tax=Patiriisocius marinistellae TaxID=2494560 RepID=A0A5J4G2F6_9FLAO|nr:hypothetical protein [Patiriisocius marinistellae]GEQ86969.1 hypothetical protein ULMS_24770 [Patiriisocius marinistellae]
MTKKTAETASFMVRFNQKIYTEKGENKVQWRGKVSHVQGGEELNFLDFNDAAAFIQERLAALTLDATQDKSTEEQESILKKSYSLFKTFAATGPQFLKETLKDPRKQVAHLQDQLNEYGEELLEKVPIDQWRNASKSDFQDIKESISALTIAVAKLNKKVESLNGATLEKKPASRKTTVKKTPPKKTPVNKSTVSIKKKTTAKKAKPTKK